MSKGTCSGDCCVAFYLPVTKEQLDARAEGGQEEILKIAAMAVPITNGTARRRRNKHMVGKVSPISKQDEGHYFKCKNWDAETRLCMDYENRPNMCRDYPYDKECSNGCGFCPAKDVIEKYKQSRVDTPAEV